MIVMTREPDGISGKIESHAQRLTQACDTLCVRYQQPLTLISTNKTYHHVITEILLKVALNTINQAIISFRPVIPAKFDHPEYTVLIIWFHFAQ